MLRCLLLCLIVVVKLCPVVLRLCTRNNCRRIANRSSNRGKLFLHSPSRGFPMDDEPYTSEIYLYTI